MQGLGSLAGMKSLVGSQCVPLGFSKKHFFNLQIQKILQCADEKKCPIKKLIPDIYLDFEILIKNMNLQELETLHSHQHVSNVQPFLEFQF